MICRCRGNIDHVLQYGLLAILGADPSNVASCWKHRQSLLNIMRIIHVIIGIQIGPWHLKASCIHQERLLWQFDLTATPVTLKWLLHAISIPHLLRSTERCPLLEIHQYPDGTNPDKGLSTRIGHGEVTVGKKSLIGGWGCGHHNFLPKARQGIDLNLPGQNEPALLLL